MFTAYRKLVQDHRANQQIRHANHVLDEANPSEHQMRFALKVLHSNEAIKVRNHTHAMKRMPVDHISVRQQQRTDRIMSWHNGFLRRFLAWDTPKYVDDDHGNRAYFD